MQFVAFVRFVYKIVSTYDRPSAGVLLPQAAGPARAGLAAGRAGRLARLRAEALPPQRQRRLDGTSL